MPTHKQHNTQAPVHQYAKVRAASVGGMKSKIKFESRNQIFTADNSDELRYQGIIVDDNNDRI